jgi:hypothetical protein
MGVQRAGMFLLKTRDGRAVTCRHAAEDCRREVFGLAQSRDSGAVFKRRTRAPRLSPEVGENLEMTL